MKDLRERLWLSPKCEHSFIPHHGHDVDADKGGMEDSRDPEEEGEVYDGEN